MTAPLPSAAMTSEAGSRSLAARLAPSGKPHERTPNQPPGDGARAHNSPATKGWKSGTTSAKTYNGNGHNHGDGNGHDHGDGNGHDHGDGNGHDRGHGRDEEGH